MEIAYPSPSNPTTLVANQTERIQVPITVDNPSYFQDPYAKITGRDASGYVLAGLVRASKFPSKQDPVAVYLVQPSGDGKGAHSQRKIFQDDGKGISTASTAVLVAINPENNEGKKQVCLDFTFKKNPEGGSSMASGRAISILLIVMLTQLETQAWLFVTGPLSLNAVSTKIDL